MILEKKKRQKWRIKKEDKYKYEMFERKKDEYELQDND